MSVSFDVKDSKRPPLVLTTPFTAPSFNLGITMLPVKSFKSSPLCWRIGAPSDVPTVSAFTVKGIEATYS